MAEFQNTPAQGRDGAVYVRQQKGHSVIKHVLLAMFTLGLSLPFTVYYVFSPNHYFHA